MGQKSVSLTSGGEIRYSRPESRGQLITHQSNLERPWSSAIGTLMEVASDVMEAGRNRAVQL